MITSQRSKDWFLIILTVILTAISCVTIYTTQVYEQGDNWQQQLIMGIIGLGCLIGLSRWRYDSLLKFHWLLYGLTNISLLVVIFAGITVNGAPRWINIAGFNVQPSEFAKLGLIITLAAILHHQDASKLSSIFKALAVVIVPWALIFIQPDLGTSLVFGVVTLAMLYWANANFGWILLMISPLFSAFLFNLFLPGWVIFTALMVLIAWFTLPDRALWSILVLFINYSAGKLGGFLWNLLKDYQKARITLFLDPEQDPLGGGYHLIQSRIAIGSGGLWGNGFMNGSQTQLDFVPEQHTDFIFSAIADQFGFVGSAVVLVLIWLVCWRLVYIATRAKDNFGSLIAIGVLAMIAFQAIINIAMTVGLAPITGIPLPFLSYGRSSLLTNFLAFGIVESIASFKVSKKTKKTAKNSFPSLMIRD
ncbi:rod shape-determining protein RodA [Cyanobacterium sp. IPPAS B-1200]|uniref:rod shape-determining protein RodA n=1 Tax=Cyanobacterium sp. IPPAS B-1200 TaxID=1562720 RepID=UPI00085248E9|nr:rod shape-determining protein RodA [Cyanobacterium sp. IPPAS B-1200]OEJ79770.1 rod shape-determining protein RodA [Cyanobacterium sp. IPPAS B-1200]